VDEDIDADVMASKIFWMFYGPRLIRTYKNGQLEGQNYTPGMIESLPDKVISTVNTAIGVSYWTSPIIGTIMYRRGYFTNEGLGSLLKMAITVFMIYSVAFVIRGIGRFSNADYRAFINNLVEVKTSPTVLSKKELASYDFEFWAWPVDFKWNETQGSSKGKSRKTTQPGTKDEEQKSSNIISRFLGYLAMNTFGRAMVYPGATSFMNYVMGSMLNSGRATLVEELNGVRAKLLAEGDNEVDTMFVDRRGKHANGSTLVIGFEGNAGFYEMGCTGTPLDLNYSVLGWNHPGFGGSSGTPSPDTEQKAVDAVMQYAIHKLGFQPKNIALFAWSIGGYSAAWAAKTYPDVKFVILDATFDDIVPLAVTKMPASWEGLVEHSLKSYMDLNVGKQLIEYPGPVLLIKRTRDEIISTVTPQGELPVISSNRGNFLLITLLKYRYPTIIDNSTLPAVKAFVGLETYRQATTLKDKGVDPEQCLRLITSHVQQNGGQFPMQIDLQHDQTLKTRLALYLVTAHMENFESTHCTPLPGHFFHQPWSPTAKL